MVPEAASGVPHQLVRRGRPQLSARLLAAALVVAGVAGCASVPRLPGERRDDQLVALEARVLELAQKSAVQEVELGRLRQQVAALEARLAVRGGGTASSPAGAVAPPVATPGARVTTAPPPPTASGGARSAAAAPAVRPAVPPRRAPSALEESELPLDEPVPPPAPRAASAPPPAPAAAPARAASAAGATEGEPVSREAQAVYDEAYTAYHQGKYPQAEARFEEFLAQSPRSELSDNAQYWIGAARFARGDFHGSLAAFRRTVERYPDANKVPDALYKMGQALEELHEPGQAVAVYAELVRRYPDTAAATLAAERQAKLPR